MKKKPKNVSLFFQVVLHNPVKQVSNEEAN